MRGTLATGKTLRRLRELYLPVGWQRSRDQNYETVVNPKSGLAITVAAGDAQTGRPTRTPCTRSEKGRVTREAIDRNLQRSFADLDGAGRKVWEVLDRLIWQRDGPARQTWLLLHFWDDQANEVRLELSMPGEMNEQGVVTGWRERIILDPISLDPTAEVAKDEPSDPIDFEVPRKSG